MHDFKVVHFLRWPVTNCDIFQKSRGSKLCGSDADDDDDDVWRCSGTVCPSKGLHELNSCIIRCLNKNVLQSIELLMLI